MNDCSETVAPSVYVSHGCLRPVDGQIPSVAVDAVINDGNICFLGDASLVGVEHDLLVAVGSVIGILASLASRSVQAILGTEAHSSAMSVAVCLDVSVSTGMTVG